MAFILLRLLADFFAGVFLCNCIPHLVSGLCGQSFPTPFASPPGAGNSSALVNFIWGFFNLVIVFLLLSVSHIAISLNTGLVLFLAGFFLIGIFLSRHFAKVRAGSQGR